jgi:hypothetical protein
MVRTPESRVNHGELVLVASNCSEEKAGWLRPLLGCVAFAGSSSSAQKEFVVRAADGDYEAGIGAFRSAHNEAHPIS